MKLFYSVLILAVTFAGCSSSKSDAGKSPTKRPNQISLNPPETQQYNQSKVYVDSVSIVDQGLLISGDLPDGCSKLHKASHTMQNESVTITLTAWKPAGTMCTQALTPFLFTYEKLSQNQLLNADVITINKKAYQINS